MGSRRDEGDDIYCSHVEWVWCPNKKCHNPKAKAWWNENTRRFYCNSCGYVSEEQTQN